MVDLTTVLAFYKPQIAARYAKIVRHQFDLMIGMHGPALKGVRNCWTFARIYDSLVRSNLTRAADGAYSIDEHLMAAAADRYASDTVEAWAGKIKAKLGGIDHGKVCHMDDVAFRVIGQRAGCDVSITQQMIINVSSQGKPFNQFPSRIKVNGKTVSEAAYKRLMEQKTSAHLAAIATR